jgi:hypothetical protein
MVGHSTNASTSTTDLKSPRKSATLRTGCLLKENGVTDVEACVPVPPRV